MSSIITNLVSNGTNVATAITNLSGASTNGVTLTHGSGGACFSLSIVGLMALGVLFGSVGSFCYQQGVLAGQKSQDDEKPKVKRAFLTLVRDAIMIGGMGIAAVALVPAFLRTVSSNLIKEAETSFEAKLVFLAFCVAATLVARRLIGTLPEKLFNLAKAANDHAMAAEDTANRVVRVVADRTAPNRDLPLQTVAPAGTAPPPEPTNAGEVVRNENPVRGYDFRALLVVRGLLNPRYAQGRSVNGLAIDTGLMTDQVAESLANFQRDGIAAIFIGSPNKGPLWYLTSTGRQIFGGRDFERNLPEMLESGIQ